MKYIKRHDWVGAADSDAEPDEVRLVSHLTQHRVRVTLGNVGVIEVPLGRLIAAVGGMDKQIIPEIAEAELKDYGVKWGRMTPKSEYGFFVSTNHTFLKRILAGTPWSAGWGRSLARLPGAMPSGKGVRFGSGPPGKATWIPRDVIDSREGDD